MTQTYIEPDLHFADLKSTNWVHSLPVTDSSMQNIHRCGNRMMRLPTRLFRFDTEKISRVQPINRRSSRVTPATSS